MLVHCSLSCEPLFWPRRHTVQVSQLPPPSLTELHTTCLHRQPELLRHRHKSRSVSSVLPSCNPAASATCPMVYVADAAGLQLGSTLLTDLDYPWQDKTMQVRVYSLAGLRMLWRNRVSLPAYHTRDLVPSCKAQMRSTRKVGARVPLTAFLEASLSTESKADLISSYIYIGYMKRFIEFTM